MYGHGKASFAVGIDGVEVVCGGCVGASPPPAAEAVALTCDACVAQRGAVVVLCLAAYPDGAVLTVPVFLVVELDIELGAFVFFYAYGADA